MCNECHQEKCSPMCGNFNSEPMCQCKQCHQIIFFNNDYITDNEDNIFCSDDCAIKYHGIVEKEWNEDDREYQR